MKTAVTYHVNGAAGSLSRIINPVLGGHMIFCVDRYNDGSTMEQLNLKTTRIIIDNMKKNYITEKEILMRKIKLGQIGIGHNHDEGKML